MSNRARTSSNPDYFMLFHLFMVSARLMTLALTWCVQTFLLSGIVMYLLWRDYRYFLRMRCALRRDLRLARNRHIIVRLSAANGPKTYEIVMQVTELPKSNFNDARLFQYFDSAFPGQVV
jgi:hypothetical protein